MKVLAIVATLAIYACAPDNGCKAAMAEYGRAVATPSSADNEPAWLGIPHFCEGRPDRP